MVCSEWFNVRLCAAKCIQRVWKLIFLGEDWGGAQWSWSLLNNREINNYFLINSFFLFKGGGCSTLGTPLLLNCELLFSFSVNLWEICMDCSFLTGLNTTLAKRQFFFSFIHYSFSKDYYKWQLFCQLLQYFNFKHFQSSLLIST